MSGPRKHVSAELQHAREDDDREHEQQWARGKAQRAQTARPGGREQLVFEQQCDQERDPDDLDVLGQLVVSQGGMDRPVEKGRHSIPRACVNEDRLAALA